MKDGWIRIDSKAMALAIKDKRRTSGITHTQLCEMIFDNRMDDGSARKMFQIYLDKGEMPEKYYKNFLEIMNSDLNDAPAKKLDDIPRKPMFNDFPAKYYQELAARIVYQAFQDYKNAREYMARKKRDPAKEKLFERDIVQCEKFFKSDYFHILMPHTDREAFFANAQKHTRYGT